MSVYSTISNVLQIGVIWKYDYHRKVHTAAEYKLQWSVYFFVDQSLPGFITRQKQQELKLLGRVQYM